MEIEKEEEKKEEKKKKEDAKEEAELIIAEKPTAAMRIAYALADIAPVKRNIKGVPYYEAIHSDRKIIVACAVGHLFGLAKKETEKTKVKAWPVFDLEWQPSYFRKDAAYTKKYANALSVLSKQATSFSVATDYDIEGEVIGLNVVRFICKQKDAKRMKFSTLTKQDIQEAYKNALPTIDWPLAYAGETRHYLDYYWGVNLSRALMQAIKKTGTFKILSIGRVQGPALALVVKREKAIAEFKPIPYWLISLIVSNHEEVEVKYPKEIFSKEEALQFGKLKGKSGEAKTEKIKQRIEPLHPFDLTTLQLEAYRFFGITPSQLLQIAQQLYLAGLISYPRTSSQKLPAAIGYSKIISKLGSVFPDLTKLTLRKNPIEGKKTDPAHPAIFPTGEKPWKLNKEERQIYELIVRRFLACFGADALIENKTIIVDVEGKEFFAKGSKILERGWLDIYKAKVDERELPDVEGKVTVKSVKIDEKETQPPRRYNPASLVAELTKRNLGTKGTRALIVDTLYKRDYIKEKQIEATSLGISVADTLHKNCPFILDEELTRKFEKEMDAIQTSKKEKGEQEQERILKEAKEVLQKICAQLKSKEDDIGKELAEAYGKVQEKEREESILCECPVCGKGKLRMMKSKKSGKRFLGCSNYPKCTNSYPLPQYGLIKKAGKLCECGFPLLLLIRKGKRPWEFCFNLGCKRREKESN